MARIPGIYLALYKQVLTNQTISPVPYSEITLMNIYEYFLLIITKLIM